MTTPSEASLKESRNKIYEGNQIKNERVTFLKPLWATDYFLLGRGWPHSIQFLDGGLIKIAPWKKLRKP